MLKAVSRCALAVCAFGLLTGVAMAENKDQTPYWLDAMKKVHEGFAGTPGHVAQLGDDMTDSMAFWSVMSWTYPDNFLEGEGAVAADGFPKKPTTKPRWRDVILGATEKGEAHGSRGGWTIDELLSAVDGVLQNDKPEVAIIMIGTNDIRNYANQAPPQAFLDRYKTKLQAIVDKCEAAHCVPILNTIPPRRDCALAVDAINKVIKEIATTDKVPLVDLYAAIKERRADDWDGTLIAKNGRTLSNAGAGNKDYSAENLKNNGFALRNWLNFLMFREVYFRVLTAK